MRSYGLGAPCHYNNIHYNTIPPAACNERDFFCQMFFLYEIFVTKNSYKNIFSTCDLADFIKAIFETVSHTIRDNSSMGDRFLKIAVPQVKQSAQLILQSDTAIFNQYRQMLTDRQWRLLVAIAKEGKVEKPTSRKFLQQYALPSASTIQSLLPILVEKEILTESFVDGSSVYSVSDIFFSHWLALNF